MNALHPQFRQRNSDQFKLNRYIILERTTYLVPQLTAKVTLEHAALWEC